MPLAANERSLNAHSIEHLSPMPLAAVVFSVNCVVHVLLHAWKKLVMGVCVCPQETDKHSIHTHILSGSCGPIWIAELCDIALGGLG